MPNRPSDAELAKLLGESAMTIHRLARLVVPEVAEDARKVRDRAAAAADALDAALQPPDAWQVFSLTTGKLLRLAETYPLTDEQAATIGERVAPLYTAPQVPPRLTPEQWQEAVTKGAAAMHDMILHHEDPHYSDAQTTELTRMAWKSRSECALRAAFPTLHPED